MGFHHLIEEEVLAAGKKEGLLPVDLLIESFEVRIAFIHDIVGSGFYILEFQDIYFMHTTVGNVNIHRNESP